jgi:hypothetical protein
VEIDQPVRYLMIAGYADGRRGRPDSRVSVFGTAAEAEAQFRRLHGRSAAVWAELVAVDLAGRLALLRRFGGDQGLAGTQAATNLSASEGSAPTWRWT